MKKNRWLYSIPIVATLLLGLLLAVPATAQTAVTISLNKAWVTTTAPANTITVTVTDADANANAGAAETVNVTAVSPLNTTGITVVLTETDVNTGTFTGTFAVTADGAGGTLAAADGNVITVTYAKVVGAVTQNFNATATVDTVAPSIVGFVPAHQTATSATQILVQVQASDGLSGFIPDNTGTTPNEALANASFVIADVSLAPQNATVDSNGLLTVSLSVSLLANATHSWNVTVTDRAGNTAQIDVDTATAGVQDPTVTVDQTAPVLASALTGKAYDAATNTEKSDRKSIRVLFTEQHSRIDPATVTVNSFTVGGQTPVGVTVPTQRPAGIAGNAWPVYLTMANDLVSDAKPVVSLIGQLRDVAGNTANVSQVPSTDGIAPKLTVTVTGDAASRPIAKTTLKVRITSDEALSTAPTVVGTKMQLVGGNIVENPAASSGNIASTPVSGATYTWEANVTRAGIDGQDGLVNIRVSASDLNTQVAQVGQGWSGAPIDLTKAFLGEFDNALNGGAAPTFTVNPAVGAGQTDSTAPFIRIDFDAEGTEYNIGGTNSFVFSGQTVRVDAHPTVNLTLATFGPEGQTGANVLSQVQRIDDNSFIFLATDLQVGGRYTLSVNAADVLGNTSTVNFSTTFEVVPAKAFAMQLVPGWNLISFPDKPGDPSLDTIFGNAAITTVMTYDPFDAVGPWLVAQKGSDGKFNTAQLMVVDEKHAYWVESSSFVNLQVVIPRRTASSEGGRLQPPAINIIRGWNLVPVVDLSLQPVGTTIPAATYFGTASWSFAYQYSPTTNTWTRITPTGNVQVGSGYWLWATADGVLVP